MKNSLANPRVKSGFTLTELLIVIGIIALLAAIMFPVFGRVRENGRRSACSSNLKQLGLAFSQYVNDNAGRYPFAGNYQNWAQGAMWVTGGENGVPKDYPMAGPGLAENTAPFNYAGDSDNRSAYPEQGAIYSYVREASVYMCPSGEDADKKKLSYSMNCAIGAMGQARIKEPSDIVLLVDEGKSLNDGFFWAANDGAATDLLTKQHLGGGNLLFTDGHVKFYPFESFPLDGTQAGRDNKWRTTGSPRFHDKAFGPNGSYLRLGRPKDVCLIDAPAGTTPPTP